jgi:phosphoribosylglycinamide formyltransferase-1
MTEPIRIAVFASGTGSNALALLEASQRLAPAVEIPLLICDQPQAPILQKLAPFPTAPVLVERTAGRSAQEAAILQHLTCQRVDWIFLAGYMRLLSPDFVQQWQRLHGGAAQIVNVHPSLLPAYRGLHAVEQAVAAGEREIGVTIHTVDAGMDTGRIIAQDVIERAPGETAEQLMPRVHRLEHQLYPRFLRQVALGEVPTQSLHEVDRC